MIMVDQIYAQALLLAGELDQQQMDMLRLLCTTASSSLKKRMKNDLTPDDCKADFIAAASLIALAALSDMGDNIGVEQMSLGDLTIRKKSRDAAANCLRNQAELMISPYLKDRFSFLGV